jgi:hypothetical protein
MSKCGFVQVKSSLKGGRPGTAGLDAMSPAAQRLVSSKLGKHKTSTRVFLVTSFHDDPDPNIQNDNRTAAVERLA